MPSSGLVTAAAARVVADAHSTLYKHLSLLLTLCDTHERLCLGAHVAHRLVMPVARRQRARTLNVRSRLAQLACELIVNLEPARRPSRREAPRALYHLPYRPVKSSHRIIVVVTTLAVLL